MRLISNCLLIAGLLTSFGLYAEPYEFKGLKLGSDLKDFKTKYHRTIPSHNQDAPHCSESTKGKAISTLLSEEWHGKANIVHCRVYFPFEELRSPKATIAGADAIIQIYKFINNKLYEVVSLINQSDFEQVKKALVAKYGEPTSQETSQYQNSYGATFSGDTLSWDNQDSSIAAVERSGRLTRSAILFVHNELFTLAEQRKPAIGTDDL